MDTTIVYVKEVLWVAGTNAQVVRRDEKLWCRNWRGVPGITDRGIARSDSIKAFSNKDVVRGATKGRLLTE